MGGCQLTLNVQFRQTELNSAEFNTAPSLWFVNATLWPADKVKFLSPGEFNKSFSDEVVDARFFFGIRHLIHIHSDIYITPRPANPSSSPFENLNHICKLAAATSSSSCSWYTVNSLLTHTPLWTAQGMGKYGLSGIQVMGYERSILVQNNDSVDPKIMGDEMVNGWHTLFLKHVPRILNLTLSMALVSHYSIITLEQHGFSKKNANPVHELDMNIELR